MDKTHKLRILFIVQSHWQVICSKNSEWSPKISHSPIELNVMSQSIFYVDYENIIQISNFIHLYISPV